MTNRIIVALAAVAVSAVAGQAVAACKLKVVVHNNKSSSVEVRGLDFQRPLADTWAALIGEHYKIIKPGESKSFKFNTNFQRRDRILVRALYAPMRNTGNWGTAKFKKGADRDKCKTKHHVYIGGSNS